MFIINDTWANQGAPEDSGLTLRLQSTSQWPAAVELNPWGQSQITDYKLERKTRRIELMENG
jgi:hypothetical protein